MADLVINVRDMSVAKNNPINIAVINEPNPVSNFTATADQVYALMNIPKYKITDSSGKIVNGENYYTFFPEKKPGGGGMPDFTKEQWATINSGLTAQDKVYAGKGISIERFGGVDSDTPHSLIPHMTSDTEPYGNVICSGYYDPRYPWYVFDGIDSKVYSSSAWSDTTNVLDGTPDACYVGYEFVDTVTVHSITISLTSDREWYGCIQCRSNGTWTTVVEDILIKRPDGASSDNVAYDFTLANDVECDAIRFSVLSGTEPRFSDWNYGGHVCEMTVYGYDNGSAGAIISTI